MAMKKGLGRGLDALLGENFSQEAENKGEVIELAVTEIEPNLEQPRKQFDQEKLETLAESIKEYGVLQPILLQKQANGFYQIIAGERRWRAAKLAGIKKVPVIVKQMERQKGMEVALIENLQRENLNPMEEAYAYKELADQFHMTQENIAKVAGKSRSAVANALRLLQLPLAIREMVQEEVISEGHARTLIPIEDEEVQMSLAKQIAEKGLSVREVESLVKRLQEDKDEKGKAVQKFKNVELAFIENKIAEKLGVKVRFVEKGQRKKMEIEYYSQEDLEKIISYFNV